MVQSCSVEAGTKLNHAVSVPYCPFQQVTSFPVAKNDTCPYDEAEHAFHNQESQTKVARICTIRGLLLWHSGQPASHIGCSHCSSISDELPAIAPEEGVANGPRVPDTHWEDQNGVLNFRLRSEPSPFGGSQLGSKPAEAGRNSIPHPCSPSPSLLLSFSNK